MWADRLMIWALAFALAFFTPISLVREAQALTAAQRMITQYQAPAAAASGSGCTQSANFLARTTGLNGTQTGAFQVMICGLVTDGVITGTMGGAKTCGTAGSANTGFDILHVYATSSTGNAVLNLCGTSFTQAINGTCTFTANLSFQGDGTSCYLDGSYTPSTSGGNIALNNASIGACLQAHLTTNVAVGGAWDGGEGIVLGADGASNQLLNDSVGPASTFTTGAGTIVRTASTGIDLYINGVHQPTLTATSSNLVSQPLFAISQNNNLAGGGGVNFADSKLSYFFAGGGFTGTQVLAIYNRLHTFLVTVNGSAGLC